MNECEKCSDDGEYARPGCASQQADSGHEAKDSSTDQKDCDERDQPGRVKKWESVEPLKRMAVVAPLGEGSGKHAYRNGPMQQRPEAVRDPENSERLHMPVHATALIEHRRIRGSR